MRYLRLLGLAKKAGRLAPGDTQAIQALRDGRAKAVFTASDAAANTQDRAKAAAAGIPCIQLPASREELGAALGMNSCAIVAVLDSGFASAVAEDLSLKL